MKVAAVMRAVERDGRADQLLVHTGQHYDAAMNDVFFADLGLATPNHYLGIGGGSHAEQTAKVMMAFEPILDLEKPDRVVVVGDVNSTLAATLVAVKRGIPVAHVEAGLRSFDRSMPEEINRIVTDSLCDQLFTHSPEARDHLLREGHTDDQIFFVGNVMIDALFAHLPQAKARQTLQKLEVSRHGYGVLTLHRPANVDDPRALDRLLDLIDDVVSYLPLIFPVHPRTAGRLEAAKSEGRKLSPNLRLAPPLGYLDFVALLDGARMVLTDSGGIQEETTALGVPCLTLRENTERPVTCQVGTNVLVGSDREKLQRELSRVLSEPARAPDLRLPDLWDGHAADRIVPILLR